MNHSSIRKSSSPKIRTRVVCLILSSDRSPWKEIQEFGQDETFVQSHYGKEIIYLRSYAHEAKEPLRLRIPVAFKTFQNWVYNSISRRRFMGWAANIALWRLGDKTLQRNGLWGLPETHAVIDSKATSSNPRASKFLTQTTDHPPLLGLKLIQSLRYVLQNYDFDFIFRTNTSSYVDGVQLVEFTKKLGPGDIYAGFQGIAPTGPFASGAGMLLSKSLVEKVLEKASRWRHGLIEDVALSVLINEELEPSIKLLPLKRVQFESLKEVRESKDDEINETFHFRCKTKSANETIKIMKEVHTRKFNS